MLPGIKHVLEAVAYSSATQQQVLNESRVSLACMKIWLTVNALPQKLSPYHFQVIPFFTKCMFKMITNIKLVWPPYLLPLSLGLTSHSASCAVCSLPFIPPCNTFDLQVSVSPAASSMQGCDSFVQQTVLPLLAVVKTGPHACFANQQCTF